MVTLQPVKQYPHTLESESITTDSTQDADGNWIPGTTTPGVSGVCRAESADGNGFITSPGGVRIDYGWILYLPINAPRLKEGTNVTVYDNGELLLTDTVKRFSRGQLNCRVWV